MAGAEPAAVLAGGGERSAVDVVLTELRRATKKFGAFHSAHEGYAVLREELDELWDEVKANNLVRQEEEAIQVAAMALRYLQDVCGMTVWNQAPAAVLAGETREAVVELKRRAATVVDPRIGCESKAQREHNLRKALAHPALADLEGE